MTNSADLPSSERRWREAAVVALVLTFFIAAFAYWLFQRGYLLYYGDAQAHLNISRSLIDSRSPGYDQLGTVWLPVLHVLCLPFVANDWLWQTGLAGTLPAATCFVIAGICFFLSARSMYASLPSAIAMLACFALNPNLLYLACIPMTESVFLAGLAVALLAIVRFRVTGQRAYLIAGVLASWWMSLTRYDGWFLIPFIWLLFAHSARQHRWAVLFSVGAALSLAPLYWIAHNWWETSNPFDFLNGPYSAAAIQGDQPYPGWHNWLQAFQYYFAAGATCAGPFLTILGTLGALLALWRRNTRIVFFLLLTPAFYVLSLHSSKTPIFLPTLWPFGYYNSRYGIAFVVFAAFAAGVLVDLVPSRAKVASSLIVVSLSVIPWIKASGPDAWICWKESERNSIARRAWTSAAARLLSSKYTTGDGVLAHFGDLTGVFPKARIPLKETLHDGNGAPWLAATTMPADFHPTKWAIGLSDDRVSMALRCTFPPLETYKLVWELQEKDSPKLEIYRRTR